MTLSHILSISGVNKFFVDGHFGRHFASKLPKMDGTVNMRFGRKSCFSTFRSKTPSKSREIDPFKICSYSTDRGLSFGGFCSRVAPIAAAWHGFEDRAWGDGKMLGVCSGWVLGENHVFRHFGPETRPKVAESDRRGCQPSRSSATLEQKLGRG